MFLGFFYVQYCVTSCNSLHNSSSPYHTISSNQQQLEKKPGGHSSKCGAKWKNYAWSVSNTLQSTWAMPCHTADTNLGGAEGFAQDERD